MAEPYWRYGAPADGGASVPMPSFPGYMPSEAPSVPLHGVWGAGDLHGASSDYLQKDIHLRNGAYGLEDIQGIGVRPEPALVGLPAGANIQSYPSSLVDPNLLSQRRDVTSGITPGIPDMVNERPNSLKIANGLPVPAGESNVLFVDGLPTDCTRREVGLEDLFRPFIGFKDIKVVHKEPRRSGDKAMVLCFVEFDDAKCAITALEALQGYKIDDKKPNSPALKIHFAHFPFRLPSDHMEKHSGASH